jgi:hypothetical protein
MVEPKIMVVSLLRDLNEARIQFTHNGEVVQVINIDANIQVFTSVNLLHFTC